MNQIHVVVDIMTPVNVFTSFFTEFVPDLHQSQYNRMIHELTTQALQNMHLSESEFLFSLINGIDFKYFEDIQHVFNIGNARNKLNELFKEYGYYLMVEINKIKINYNLFDITDYLLVAVHPSTAIIAFITKD